VNIASPPQTDSASSNLGAQPSEPARQQPLGWLGAIFAALGALVSVIYLANPTMGLFELLPDNLPVIGNLDEVFFTLLLLYCLQNLGIRLPPALAAMLSRGKRLDRPDRAP